MPPREWRLDSKTLIQKKWNNGADHGDNGDQDFLDRSD